MARKNFGAKPLTYPQPVLMIATYDENGVADIMNAAWGGITEENEITICLSPEHKTVENLLMTGAFTVSMGDKAHVVECDYLGIASANDVPNKVEKSGLTTTPSELVNAPIINELAVCLECKVKTYKTEFCRLVGEIVNVSVDEEYITDGKVDTMKIAPITFDPFNNAYHVIGEKVGEAFSDGLKIK